MLKSPVYPPPDDSSENAEFSSIPSLETLREQMSSVQGKPKESDHAIHMTTPADAQADRDHFEETRARYPQAAIGQRSK